MKKIVASVGLVALGASGLQTTLAQSVTSPDASKPWTVSAALRGFYDDNVGTLPTGVPTPGGGPRDSFGIEVAPAATIVWSVEQTTINLGALYDLKWYENEIPGTTDHTDNSFTFNGGINHAFNEQVRARANDSFVIGQEPDMLRAGSTFATFQRVSGSNIRNYGSLGLDAQLNPKFGLGFGYDNAYYNYKDTTPGVGYSGFPGIAAVQPSTGGLLNRIEQRAHVEGLMKVGPETKAILGYQYSSYIYTGNEYISGFLINPAGPVAAGNLFDTSVSDDRNNREHTMYVGAEHNFSPELTGSLRAGGSYTDYYNDSSNNSIWTPYVNGVLKYTYATDSTVSFGISYDRSATDVAIASNTGQITQDAQSFVAFAAVNHRITEKLFGTLLGQFQNSKYNGGAYDNQSEQFYLLGANVEYRFNQYFAADVGYNFDYLSSDIAYSATSSRGYHRNRVYIGVTASY